MHSTVPCSSVSLVVLSHSANIPHTSYCKKDSQYASVKITAFLITYALASGYEKWPLKRVRDASCTCRHRSTVFEFLAVKADYLHA